MKSALEFFLAILLITAFSQESYANGLLCRTFSWLCKNNDSVTTGDAIKFDRWTVADGVKGAAFNSVIDMNSDGRKDLVVSSFGDTLTMKGEIRVYYNNGEGLF
jgi:hypothetical protein